MCVKELRRKTGLSQSEFAKKYHLNLRQIQSWEQGLRQTPEGILYMLERLIDIDFPKEKGTK